MNKFLWNLNIESIPCGWETVYKDALKDCPNGKPEQIMLSNSSGIYTENIFYDPVKCRNLIIEKFNNLKVEAIELYSDRYKSDFKVCCNRLIQIDVILYNLLIDWTYTSEAFSNDEFQPKNIFKQIENYNINSYFENSDFKYDSLKFINLL